MCRPLSYIQTVLFPTRMCFSEDPEALGGGQLDHLDSHSELRGWLTVSRQESGGQVLQGGKLKLCHPPEGEKMELRVSFLKITNCQNLMMAILDPSQILVGGISRLKRCRTQTKTKPVFLLSL